MVIVLAYSHDRAAAALVERWRAAGERAAVLTAADLSRRGWVFCPGDPEAGRMVLGGERLPTSELRAVVVRVPVLGEGELPHVHADDRAYASAEMQAFLLAWLSALPCRVLNRTTPCNLGGPAWHSAEWVRRARRIGLAARAVGWRTTSQEPPRLAPRVEAGTRFVDVIGDKAFAVGARVAAQPDDAFAAAALALARDAGVEIVRAYFDETSTGLPIFVEAGMWVDLGSSGVADALTELCFGFVHGHRQASPAMAARA